MADNKKLLADTIQLGRQIAGNASPVEAIVAKCMVDRHAAGGLTKEIVGQFEEARNALLKATSPNELGSQLVGDLCSTLGIGDEVRKGLRDSYFAMLPQGLVELPQRYGEAFQRDVVKSASSALAKADVELRRQMQAVFDITPASLTDVIAGSSELQALASTILKKDGVGMTNATTKVVALIARNASSDIKDAAITYYQTFTDVKNAVEHGKAVFDAFDSSSAGSYAAAMGAATAVASALGLGEDVTDVMTKANGYLNTAAQLQQCLALTAGTGGWGAAIGLLGMANCGSGFNMFGGGAAASDQTAVLGAIAKLSARMDQHFERVNAQLRDIAKIVNQVYAELQQVHQDTAKIYDLLQRVDSRVGLLLLRGDEQARLLAELIAETANTSYSGPIKLKKPDPSLSPTVVVSALGWYGLSVPSKVASSALTTGSKLTDADVAVATIKSNFSSDASPQMVAAGQGALRFLLEKVYGLAPLPGPAVHWPSLADAIEAMCKYRWLYGNLFSECEPTAIRAPARNVQDVLRTYEVFLLSIRNDQAPGASTIGNHPLMKVLFDELDIKAKKFESAWYAIFDRAMEVVVSQLRNDTLAFSNGAITLVRQANTNLRNASGFPGTSLFRLFEETELPSLFGVRVPYPGNKSDYCFWPVVSKVQRILKNGVKVSDPFPANLYSETALIRVQGWMYPATDASLDQPGHKSVHNVLLFEDEYRVELCFDKGAHPCWTEIEPRDPLAYLIACDGDKGRPRGIDALKAHVQSSLQNSVVQGRAHDVQKQRIAYYKQMYLRRVIFELEDKAATGDLAAALKEFGDTALVVRAICRLAFEEAYGSSDFFPSLYEGGLDSRLVDGEFIKPWATALTRELDGKAPDESFVEDRMARGPGGIVGLEVVARKRLEALRVAVERLLRDAHEWGLPIEFRQVRRHFEGSFKPWLAGF
jgi:hypothetical protein